MRPTRVFIAMPYEGEDQVANVGRAIAKAEELLSHGYAPIVPHLCHLWQLRHDHPVKVWRGLMMEWLAMADCVLVIGESRGVRMEEFRADELGIPVVDTVCRMLSKIPKEMDDDRVRGEDDSDVFGENKALKKLRENL